MQGIDVDANLDAMTESGAVTWSRELYPLSLQSGQEGRKQRES
jgi:hypothetical protein